MEHATKQVPEPDAEASSTTVELELQIEQLKALRERLDSVKAQLDGPVAHEPDTRED